MGWTRKDLHNQSTGYSGMWAPEALPPCPKELCGGSIDKQCAACVSEINMVDAAGGLWTDVGNIRKSLLRVVGAALPPKKETKTTTMYYSVRA